MRKFELNKLVHDDIVEWNESLGGVVEYIVLEGPELLKALFDKMEEELGERQRAETPEERAKEVEDMKCVLYAMRSALGYDQPDPAFVPVKTFNKGHFIKTLIPPDEWVEYYAADPGRFPEVK